MFKNIIIFLAGAAIGAGGSYVYFKQVKEKEMNDEANELRELYRKKCSELNVNKKDPSEYISDAFDDEEIDNSEETDAYEQKMTSYNHMFKGSEQTIPETFDDDIHETQEEAVADDFLITEDDFALDRLFDKKSLTYYSGSDILVDEEENIVNPKDIFGDFDYLLYEEDFKSGSMYFRNFSANTDYEVLYDPSKFDN